MVNEPESRFRRNRNRLTSSCKPIYCFLSSLSFPSLPRRPHAFLSGFCSWALRRRHRLRELASVSYLFCAHSRNLRMQKLALQTVDVSIVNVVSRSRVIRAIIPGWLRRCCGGLSGLGVNQRTKAITTTTFDRWPINIAAGERTAWQNSGGYANVLQLPPPKEGNITPHIH